MLKSVLTYEELFRKHVGADKEEVNNHLGTRSGEK